MRRLAAKRQAGSTSGALRQIAYKWSAGRGKGGAATHSPDRAETLRDPRGKLPALGLSDPRWQRGPGWCSPARRVSIQLPRPSSPLCHAAPSASVSLWGWAAPPWWGCQARLSSPWGAGGTREATGQGGCLTRTVGSQPGPNPYLTPRGARLAPAVPAAWSQACPCPAQLASPKPAHRAPCITMCPSPETSSPQGHPWASPRGLRDGHDPSKALNHSPGRSNTRLPEFGWGR